jgi:hypothetical protein
MADINLFRGGPVSPASIGGGCNCGPFPGVYPAPNRVATHMRDQRFTLAAQLSPSTEANIECVLCGLASTAALQTANVIDKKIALIRVPPRHLLTAINMILTPGTGAGANFDVFAQRVNQQTGVVGAAVTLPAAAAGNVMTAALDELYVVDAANGGAWSGADVIEIGVEFNAGPTVGTVCTWTGSITLVAKVDGFDFGSN